MTTNQPFIIKGTFAKYLIMMLICTGSVLRLTAQTLAPATITGTPAAGEYYYYSGTTLTTGFSFTASPGNSLHIYYAPPPDCQVLSAQPSNGQNYIVTYVPRDSAIANPANASLTSCQVMQTIQYFDGLGRPSQTIQVRGSTNGYDLIQPIVYDAYGREAVRYLPYSFNATTPGVYRPDAITEQSSFYQQTGRGYLNFNSPYAQTVFEPSPLNRVQEQGAPGDAWQPGSNHTVKTAYGVNMDSEVIRWDLVTGGATRNNYYTANQLDKTTTTDENGNQTIIYRDKEEHTVCKMVQLGSNYLATYYVYDDYNNLAYVIPPIPAASYPASFSESDPVFSNYIYGYHYDSRNRLSEKKVPGKGWEYLVYNALDQVVASQDGVQRLTSKWTFGKYDVLGRMIETGEITDTRGHQAITDAIATQAQNWETVNGTGDGYTTVNSFPTSWNMLFTINYYDDYTFPGNGTYSSSAAQISSRTRGLLTGTKVRNLVDGTMLLTINYYDDYGRIRESIAQNHLSGSDRVVNTYNFTGQVTQTVRTHNSSAVTNLVITNQYDYDHIGRKVQSRQQTGAGNAMVILNKEEYNEIGQLKTKHLHSTNSGSLFLQDINYAYNERGWLSTSSAPLFAVQLNYNAGSAPQWNGNITSQYWGTPGNLGKHYDYTYDQLNRLTSGVSTTGYNETGIDYDNLGNLLHLTRAGGNNGGAYTYHYNGNQLNNVDNLTGVYQYDENGNVKYDARNSTGIVYNYLNLPQSIPGKNITYTYNASGKKLRRVNGTATTDYIDGIQYEGGAISFIQTEDGRAINKNDGTFNYEYTLTDHLGNSRSSFDMNSGSVAKQQDDYYPFGLDIQSTTISPPNKYLYNKKELQDGLGQYDYGARFYDPVIARFSSIDRYAEKYSSINPYQYAGNDPVLLIDLHGDSVIVGNTITSNKEANKDFNLFANSKAGRKFLSNYAAKGQEIGGYTFTKDGKYNKRGVDVIYQVGKNSRGEGLTTYNTDNMGGDTPTGSRLRETVTLDYSNVHSGLSGKNLTMDMTETIFHESFIHVDLDTKDFIDNGHLDGSNLTGRANSIFHQGYSGTAQHQQSVQDYARFGQNSLFFGQGMESLKSINEKLQTNYSVQKLLGLLNSGVSN